MAIRLADYTRDTDDTGRILIVRSYHVDTESEIDDVVAANPAYNGLDRRPDYHAENWDPDTIEAGFRVDLTFEGVDLIHGINAPESAKWSFEPSLEKEPIEKHPRILDLIDVFDGQVDPKTKRVTFPETYFASEGDTRDGSLHWRDSANVGGSGDLTENPLYGISESGYLVMTGVATCRYNTISPASAQSGIGKVFERLPYNAPDYGVDEDGRDWLKMPARITELEATGGSRWHSVEEVFLLSETGGWPPRVYNFIEV